MRHRLTRVLPYAADDLFGLVGAVEDYPKFVRWIARLRTWNRRQEGEGVAVFDAEATVKFAFISERFATRVTLDQPALTITTALISGPFRRLDNRWRFTAGDECTTLSFEIDFELRSRVLQGLLAANFERVVGALIGCFEDRAAELFERDRHGGRHIALAAED